MNESIGSKNLLHDLLAGLVVFLVALPLCLGVALASNAPLFSGILAGVIGGIVVGTLSGSHTSVSGPSPGQTAVIVTQISLLGSFEAFLAAIVLAGLIQIVLGIGKLGSIAAFFPSSVIKGLLFAIGIILILKQIPHLFGHEADSLGNETFKQSDLRNTFSELWVTVFDMNAGAAFIGLLSVAILILWDKVQILKKSQIPAPIIVIAAGVSLSYFLDSHEKWALAPYHLVQVPVTTSVQDSLSFLTFPDWNILNNSAFYVAGVMIALIASLETLLNLEALDKIDPLKRTSSPNRELMAQGVGNIVAGLVGGIPVTSVIVRSSVNINAGVKTKLSTICHGFLILSSVMFIPGWLNKIPLSTLAAILFITGLKLASPKILMQMWKEGKNQFLPFILTVAAIVLTDLLIGVLIGLGIAIYFILNSNIRRPIKKTLEKHATGDKVLHIELPNQVSFFNRASLEATLKNIAPDSHVLIDATNTDYIDPDILDLIADFQNNEQDTRKIVLSLVGFKNKYPQLEDRINYADFSSMESQKNLTSDQVLEILKEGNLRFREGTHLMRNLSRQLEVASLGQFPMAVVLSCIDSRSPVELLFDLSIGDIFSVRIAGNVVSEKVLGSIEYSCAVAGAKLILIMGHTSCGAVKASVDFMCSHKTAKEATGCMNLESLISEIQKSIDHDGCKDYNLWNIEKKEEYLDDLAYKNVLKSMQKLRQKSSILDGLVKKGEIALVGAMYNIGTAEVIFFQSSESSAPQVILESAV